MRSHKPFLLLTTLLGSLSFSIIASAGDATVQQSASYGLDIPESGKIWALSKAIDNLTVGDESKELKTIKISGIITQVCQKKGCWLVLTDGEQFARVTFKDYKTFVPTDTGTEPGIVLGVLSEKKLTASAAKHYASDAGESTELVVARREYSIVAEAIRIGAKS
jgi:hypothetical protein